MKMMQGLLLSMGLLVLASCMAGGNKTNSAKSSAANSDDAQHYVADRSENNDAGISSSSDRSDDTDYPGNGGKANPNPINAPSDQGRNSQSPSSSCIPLTDLTRTTCSSDSSPVTKYTVSRGTLSNNCNTIKVFKECLDNNCGKKYLSNWKDYQSKQLVTVYDTCTPYVYQNCTYNGQSINHGTSKTFTFYQGNATKSKTCAQLKRNKVATCDNGTLSWDPTLSDSYTAISCREYSAPDKACTPRTDLTSTRCTSDSSPVEMFTVRQGTTANDCAKIKVFKECLNNNCDEKYFSNWKDYKTKQLVTVYDQCTPLVKQNCEYNGTKINHDSSKTFTFYKSDATDTKTCDQLKQDKIATCNNGKLSWSIALNNGYNQTSCKVYSNSSKTVENDSNAYTIGAASVACSKDWQAEGYWVAQGTVDDNCYKTTFTRPCITDGSQQKVLRNYFTDTKSHKSTKTVYKTCTPLAHASCRVDDRGIPHQGSYTRFTVAVDKVKNVQEIVAESWICQDGKYTPKKLDLASVIKEIKFSNKTCTEFATETDRLFTRKYGTPQKPCGNTPTLHKYCLPTDYPTNKNYKWTLWHDQIADAYFADEAVFKSCGDYRCYDEATGVGALAGDVFKSEKYYQNYICAPITGLNSCQGYAKNYICNTDGTTTLPSNWKDYEPFAKYRQHVLLPAEMQLIYDNQRKVLGEFACGPYTVLIKPSVYNTGLNPANGVPYLLQELELYQSNGSSTDTRVKTIESVDHSALANFVDGLTCLDQRYLVFVQGGVGTLYEFGSQRAAASRGVHVYDLKNYGKDIENYSSHLTSSATVRTAPKGSFTMTPSVAPKEYMATFKNFNLSLRDQDPLYLQEDLSDIRFNTLKILPGKDKVIIMGFSDDTYIYMTDLIFGEKGFGDRHISKPYTGIYDSTWPGYLYQFDENYNSSKKYHAASVAQESTISNAFYVLKKIQNTAAPLIARCESKTTCTAQECKYEPSCQKIRSDNIDFSNSTDLNLSLVRVDNANFLFAWNVKSGEIQKAYRFKVASNAFDFRANELDEVDFAKIKKLGKAITENRLGRSDKLVFYNGGKVYRVTFNSSNQFVLSNFSETSMAQDKNLKDFVYVYKALGAANTIKTKLNDKTPLQISRASNGYNYVRIFPKGTEPYILKATDKILTDIAAMDLKPQP